MRSDNPRADESVGKSCPGSRPGSSRLDGSPVAPGEVGELHVRGANVMLGYYKAPDLTAKVIDRDGWFNTGDLARFDGPYLFIVGRTKELIIRSGFNVYPAEVEAVLNSHDLVVQSAVVGRAGRGQRGGGCVRATAARRRRHAGGADRLCRRAAHVLQTASEIIVLDALPASSTGKILKHRLWESARSA